MTELQPTLTTLFLDAFVHRILLEGARLTENNMATMLEASIFVARHTALWHFFREACNVPLTVCEYKWFHNTMRPDGEDIGLQCPGCGSLASREGIKSQAKTAEGKTERWVDISCVMDDCAWQQRFHISEDVKDLKTGEHGLWTACTYKE